jgi:hypothetical protein
MAVNADKNRRSIGKLNFLKPQNFQLSCTKTSDAALIGTKPIGTRKTQAKMRDLLRMTYKKWAG